MSAFKEAYEEFKHVLLAFIYDKDDQTSPVANEVGCYLYVCTLFCRQLCLHCLFVLLFFAFINM